MTKKLIIWDFDGVISDTEKLWLHNRMITINKKFNTHWDMETTYKYLGGKSDKTKKEVLDKLGLFTDDAFWKENYQLDMQNIDNGFDLTPDIEKIFKSNLYNQCIATGGTKEKTELKIKQVGIEKYFPPQNVFTADMVNHGKPEPDLFLFSAKKMGVKPENCIVIEDSPAGITAAVRAGMTVLAYAAYTKEFNIEENKAKKIFYNMKDLADYLNIK